MTPKVSVVVSTRDRPEQIVPCARAILANHSDDFELVVVDQSKPGVSAKAREAMGADGRLRWIESATRGLSVSRNIAVAAARAPVILFTDDDCHVPLDWIEGVRGEFDADPSLSILFGGVTLPPEERTQGFAASFEPDERTEFVNSFPRVNTPWGVGANMAVRREVFDRVGMFDPILGAGARFMAGEETDLTIRALAAGLKVVNTPAHAVTHLGVRKGADAGRLMRGYGFGLGATFAKHVRLGTPGGARLLADWLTFHGMRSARNLLQGDRHPGFGLLAAVVWGACRSCTEAVDRGRAVYATEPKTS